MLNLRTVNDFIDAKLTHSLHTSESRSFRGCRRRWNWIFHEYYYPLTTPQPLEFGVAFHKGMETWYEPDRWYKNRMVQKELAKTKFYEVCQQQREEYKRLNGSSIDPDKLLEYESNVKLGMDMLEYYCTKVSPRYDQELRPVKVEVAFEVPIISPQGKQLWCKCNTCWNRYKAYLETLGPERATLEGVTLHWQELRSKWDGLPVTYGGRIDALFEDINTGRYWVADWKTAARLSGLEGPDEYLQNDDQITRYCYALWILGIDVAGFIYHEQKKAVPTEPEPNKSRRLGRLYSVSKSNPYTYDLYRTTVEENDPDAFSAGLYDEFLQWLKDGKERPRFEARHQQHRTQAQLKNAGQDLFLEASDMVDPDLRLYPSAGRFSCSTCAFRQPCLMKNMDEDYQYTLDSLFEKRRYHYWETKELSTESKGGI
jgi:hypothetical protein